MCDFCHADITVGFNEIAYDVPENATTGQVCVSILSGRLAADRNVTVLLHSMDMTATGSLICDCPVGGVYAAKLLLHLPQLLVIMKLLMKTRFC